MFVGGSVNAVRSENQRKVSDVVDILLFLAEFVKEKRHTIRLLDRLLGGKPGLLDQHGNEIFATAFGYLANAADRRGNVRRHPQYCSSTRRPRRSCTSLNLKGTDGEIALRLGENDAFGLINVGDASALCKLCEEHHDLLVVDDKEFSGSLFAKLSDGDSTVNVLIGSKKFTEGWNSWRVSTMGLMNVGKSEGSEIIQLFGRGVRLKGYGMCLKRSSQIDGIPKPPAHQPARNAEYLRHPGAVHAAVQGVSGGRRTADERGPHRVHPAGGEESRRQEAHEYPARRRAGLQEAGPEADARRADFVSCSSTRLCSTGIRRFNRSKARAWLRTDDIAVMEAAHFKDKHLAFMDIDAIYFELQRFKNERAWYNLNLPRESIL